MSKKNYRYNKDVKWNLEDAMKFFQKLKGRIKRIRSRRESRYLNLDKRIGERSRQIFIMSLFYKITRWTRH